VLISVLSGPAALVVIAGIVAALLCLTRRDRAIRRNRGRWMIPRHFEPDQYALLEQAELVAEAVAPAASIVSGSQNALAADVEAFEQLAALVASAEATQGVPARLAEVRRRTDRVAELVAEAKGDRPILDDDVLTAKTAEARQQLDGLVAQARAQAAWVLAVDGPLG
jgi:hypothetical protein